MYLAIEGIDTAGKSTQIARLRTRFHDAVFTKEPGGTETGERLRTLLLETGVVSKRAETLLFLADRSEHIAEIVVPNRQRLIVSDRSAVSGIAYAMAENRFKPDELLWLNRFATEGIFPDAVVILKLDADELSRRLAQKKPDVIEIRGTDYLLRIQEHLETAAKLLEIPVVVIDAALPPDTIADTITDLIEKGET